MPNPFARHQFKLVKDKHNIMLILVSSSKFNSLFRRFIKILGSKLFIFSFRSSKFSWLYHREAPSNQCKDSSYSFQASFLRDHLFIYPEFFESFFWWFIKDLIPSRSVLQDSCWRSSGIRLLAFRSAILPTLSFEVVLCHFDSFLHVS